MQIRFFLSKIDKDLKSVIENIFFIFFYDFKKGAIGWKFQQFANCYYLLLFTNPYLYLK